MTLRYVDTTVIERGSRYFFEITFRDKDGFQHRVDNFNHLGSTTANGADALAWNKKVEMELAYQENGYKE